MQKFAIKSILTISESVISVRRRPPAHLYSASLFATCSQITLLIENSLFPGIHQWLEQHLLARRLQPSSNKVKPAVNKSSLSRCWIVIAISHHYVYWLKLMGMAASGRIHIFLRYLKGLFYAYLFRNKGQLTSFILI